jgi:maltose O-acetyltransferase
METEKTRMINGKPYLSNDQELFDERQVAKDLVYQVNALHPCEIGKRHELLTKLLGRVGKNLFIEPPFRCDYGYNISVGDNFYSNYNLVVLDCAPVSIGHNVMIAPNVGIFTAGHPIHYEPRNKYIEYAFPITIGDNVWIGGHVVINPGISIGTNSVIGAGSVVVKDIPANVVAVGNPCKVIREIRDEDSRYYFKDRLL